MTTTTLTAQDTVTLDDATSAQTPNSASGNSSSNFSPTEPVVAPQPVQKSESAFAITSFVLGVASIVSGWTFIAPIIGLVFGVLALRRKTAERTLALWGVWLNVAMLALTVLALIAVIVFGGIALLAGLPLLEL